MGFRDRRQDRREERRDERRGVGRTQYRMRQKLVAIGDDKRHTALPQAPRQRGAGESLTDDEDAG